MKSRSQAWTVLQLNPSAVIGDFGTVAALKDGRRPLEDLSLPFPVHTRSIIGPCRRRHTLYPPLTTLAQCPSGGAREALTA